MTEEQKEE